MAELCSTLPLLEPILTSFNSRYVNGIVMGKL